MTTSLLCTQHNANEWQNPLEFIPERFNPNSPYFLKPNGKQRSPYAYMPFMVGGRSCPGQILAMLELKILVAKIITSIDYDIDQELIDNKYARFSLFSHFRLKLKFNKKLE